jgi:hypothetical protein
MDDTDAQRDAATATDTQQAETAEQTGAAGDQGNGTGQEQTAGDAAQLAQELASAQQRIKELNAEAAKHRHNANDATTAKQTLEERLAAIEELHTATVARQQAKLLNADIEKSATASGVTDPNLYRLAIMAEAERFERDEDGTVTNLAEIAAGVLEQYKGLTGPEALTTGAKSNAQQRSALSKSIDEMSIEEIADLSADDRAKLFGL